MEPERVSMIYWFTAAPEAPLRFDYSSAWHVEGRERLAKLVGEVLAGDRHQAWPLTAEERRCRHCVFRSLCARGVVAGSLGELEVGADGERGFSLAALFEAVDEVGF